MLPTITTFLEVTSLVYRFVSSEFKNSFTSLEAGCSNNQLDGQVIPFEH